MELITAHIITPPKGASILMIRGQKVILDAVLADLHEESGSEAKLETLSSGLHVPANRR